MSDITPESRADNGRQTLKAYEIVMDQCYDVEDELVDLLTDLCHLAQEEGISPYGVVNRAIRHYEAEIAAEPEFPLAPSDEEIEADLSEPGEPCNLF